MQEYPEYVPGLPIKRNSPLIDPEQEMCPHVVEVIEIKEDENGEQYVSDEKLYAPNILDYPEW